MTLDDLIRFALDLKARTPAAGKAPVHFLTESGELGDALSGFNLINRQECVDDGDELGLKALDDAGADNIVTLG